MSNITESPAADATAIAADTIPLSSQIGQPLSSLTKEATEEDTPLTAANVTTSAELALLKTTYNELKAAKKAAIEEEEIARKEREAQPGWSWRDEYKFSETNDESWELFKKIAALGLPEPHPLRWALVELSADFKRAHKNSKLAKFKIAKGREWFDDRCDLITRLEVYVLMRFGASKKVNEDGIASYMSIEPVHNLWTLCRHLINHYNSLGRSEKGQATKALKDRILAKYKLKTRKSLVLPGISDIPPWTTYWDTFPEGQTLRDLCQFDLSSDIKAGDSKSATVDDGTLVIECGWSGSGFTQSASWEPHTGDKTRNSTSLPG